MILQLKYIILVLQNRYQNRPIVEFQIAAEEQMKITELRLAKLFSEKGHPASASDDLNLDRVAKKSEGIFTIQSDLSGSWS